MSDEIRTKYKDWSISYDEKRDLWFYVETDSEGVQETKEFNTLAKAKKAIRDKEKVELGRFAPFQAFINKGWSGSPQLEEVTVLRLAENNRIYYKLNGKVSSYDAGTGYNPPSFFKKTEEVDKIKESLAKAKVKVGEKEEEVRKARTEYDVVAHSLREFQYTRKEIEVKVDSSVALDEMKK